MSWVAAGLGAASIVSGLFGASSAQKAAQQQAQAEEQATALQAKEFNTITTQESPFMQGGYSSLGQLNYLMGQGTPGQGGLPTSSSAGGYGSLNAPFTADMMKQYSPAYQFQLQQGQAGVLNGDSSSVGALSGAALKDLTGYNQNLANTSFNNAFNQYQTQQQNVYGRLSGIAQLGQNAAANTGMQGTALTGQMSNSLSNIGTAQAGGTVGAANAITGGVNNLGALLAQKFNSPPPPQTGTDVGNGSEEYPI